ncbi:MAG TPA: hypothetical protein VFP19_05430 [Candidatus Limnocylindrales bacterium]|nr:hypothetical protein [Candidatus Limnocylindrales bacterium]
MTAYKIMPKEQGLAIEITGVGDERDALLAAFGECAAGQCTCPTDEYDKVETMAIAPAKDRIAIDLAAKQGTEFDPGAIERCLDNTVEQARR